MLNKNKKMRGKPWTGRGRGRGDQGMDDNAPVSLSWRFDLDLRTLFNHRDNFWSKMQIKWT